MKTGAEITAYLANLDRADECLENGVVKHQQLH
jgi:hypothetical protein